MLLAHKNTRYRGFMANLFDSANYAETEPAKFIAGDRLAWKRSNLTNYPPATYQLQYSARLEGNGATEITITASGSGSDFVVEVGKATTVNYTAGVYHWQAYIVRTSDSERVTVDSGIFEVIANRDTATTDPRSKVKIGLDNIDAVMQKRSSKDQDNYTISGRSLGRTPIADLILLRKFYQKEYDKELLEKKIERGLGTNSGMVKFRF